MKNVLSLTAKEAKDYFLRQENFCNFDLPDYFRFQGLLDTLATKMSGKKLSDLCLKNKKPWFFDDVNYKLVSNKDGKYAWRPLQLIHPVLYVDLVHVVTAPAHWKQIQERFSFLKRKSPNINCAGLPVVSKQFKKNKAAQISHWVTAVEKKSISYAMQYDHVLHSDITDCYSSIYTHSIAWALHGKEKAKKKKNDRNLLGNIVDERLRGMSYGQTNGIPQGSVLMDFIAEIVLCYADTLLAERIERIKKTEYRIVRYRDDYRVFTQNSQVADQIIRELTDVLNALGLKINSSKTKGSDKVVHTSIKSDKLSWIRQEREHDSLDKELLAISIFSEEFPNSGQLTVALTKFYKRIENLKRNEIRGNLNVLISIVVDLAYKNPRVYPVGAAIISKFLDFLPTKTKKSTATRILNKFRKLPNTGMMQIWLQRIILKLDHLHDHDEKLCQKVLDKNMKIWNSEWLKQPMRRMVDICNVIDQTILTKMSPVISRDEVELFQLSEYPS